jgi:gamma-butyrobetaine dioxygenase
LVEVSTSADTVGLVVSGLGDSCWTVHPLWLRERCKDGKNVDPMTGQRLYNPSGLDAELSLISATETRPGEFAVVFSDGAQARFRADEILAELACGPADSDAAPVAWTAATTLPDSIDWRDCAADAARLATLRAFLVSGYVIFNHVPATPGAVLDVARRFGFPRETNFGVLFDVQSVPDACDLAYTSLPLDPHTDNPYRAPVPGIQLLHCLVNETPGGLSTLVDGMAVAEALRADDPAAFASLTSVNVRFRYTDAGTELVASRTLIELDADGTFAAIHYSPRLDFAPLLPLSELDRFYAARRRLDGMLKSAEFERRFRLGDGDLMMFDNRRLLHGRTGFDPQTGRRHLQGCYIDADAPRSQYRILRRRLA